MSSVLRNAPPHCHLFCLVQNLVGITDTVPDLTAEESAAWERIKDGKAEKEDHRLLVRDMFGRTPIREAGIANPI